MICARCFFERKAWPHNDGHCRLQMPAGPLARSPGRRSSTVCPPISAGNTGIEESKRQVQSNIFHGERKKGMRRRHVVVVTSSSSPSSLSLSPSRHVTSLARPVVSKCLPCLLGSSKGRLCRHVQCRCVRWREAGGGEAGTVAVVVVRHGHGLDTCMDDREGARGMCVPNERRTGSLRTRQKSE